MSDSTWRGREQEFHDRQADERLAFFSAHPEGLLFGDDWFLDHETWIRPAFDFLGDFSGKAVLDLGCGNGMGSVVLARRGARVTAIDLSPAYLTEARWRARANGVDVRFLQADGGCLPFPNGCFDHVWGNAVLHHLDLEVAGGELLRVLRAGGSAVFCEPWGGNPVLNWVRRCLPYPGKDRTHDEAPLRHKHVLQLRTVFPKLQIRGFQFLSMARRVLGPGRALRSLEWCDERLLRAFPGLERLCRYVVIYLPP